MHAYPDRGCSFGYMVICDECRPNVRLSHVDATQPITNPPAVGKLQECEICGKRGILDNPPLPSTNSLTIVPSFSVDEQVKDKDTNVRGVVTEVSFDPIKDQIVYFVHWDGYGSIHPMPYPKEKLVKYGTH